LTLQDPVCPDRGRGREAGEVTRQRDRRLRRMDHEHPAPAQFPEETVKLEHDVVARDRALFAAYVALAGYRFYRP